MSTTQSTRKAILGAVAAVAASPVPARRAADLGRGNVAVAASGQNRVYRLDSLGRAAVLEGSGRVGFRGDGGPATLAMLNVPSALVVDVWGNLCIADTGNDRVRRVDASSGIITTVAGGGEPDGECSAATEARLSQWPGTAEVRSASSGGERTARARPGVALGGRRRGTDSGHGLEGLTAQNARSLVGLLPRLGPGRGASLRRFLPHGASLTPNRSRAHPGRLRVAWHPAVSGAAPDPRGGYTR